jgi:hypothetical protein
VRKVSAFKETRTLVRVECVQELSAGPSSATAVQLVERLYGMCLNVPRDVDRGDLVADAAHWKLCDTAVNAIVGRLPNTMFKYSVSVLCVRACDERGCVCTASASRVARSHSARVSVWR